MPSARGLAWLVVIAGALLLASPVACNKSSPVASEDGRTLFSGVCARCHGADGKGGVAAAPGLAAPRNFCDHSFHASRTDEQIRMTIVNGKGTGMPPFGTMFDEKQLGALVAYVRSLDPEKH